MLRVVWRTGVRLNELLTIRPSDIESRNNVVNISKAKGGKQRRVPLDIETIRMLSDYVSTSNIEEDQPLFGIKQGWAHELVRRYGARVGRRGLHPHTFRHSFAIHGVRSGWNIRRLQQCSVIARWRRRLFICSSLITTSGSCTIGRRFEYLLWDLRGCSALPRSAHLTVRTFQPTDYCA